MPEPSVSAAANSSSISASFSSQWRGKICGGMWSLISEVRVDYFTESCELTACSAVTAEWREQLANSFIIYVCAWLSSVRNSPRSMASLLSRSK